MKRVVVEYFIEGLALYLIEGIALYLLSNGLFDKNTIKVRKIDIKL